MAREGSTVCPAITFCVHACRRDCMNQGVQN